MDSIHEQCLDPKFFVGLEYAIDNDNVEDVKALIDRVKNFTNLFVVDSLGITLHIDNLNEVCDYVYESGLYFLVFFVSMHYLENDVLVLRYDYYPHLWIIDATKKYGDKFLGAYAMDEPGGNQLDQGDFRMINTNEIDDIMESGNLYVERLDIHAKPYTFLREYENDLTILTSDYGLYWFDYKSGYDTVLAEFAWNHSRPLHLGLCRGAANVQDRDWGVMITWTYEQPPYIISADKLYDDMILAYHTGAKYVVIFDYPATEFSEYGILTEEHFAALEQFWNYLNDNPDKHGIIKADVAYVLPENFGFGFRSADDKIWGVKANVFSEKFGQWSTEELAGKVWDDVNQLIYEYGFRLDIIYSDIEFNDKLPKLYDELFFWNEIIK
jgi:hypothetical protein